MFGVLRIDFSFISCTTCGVDVLSEENCPLAASMEGDGMDYVSSDGLYMRTVFQNCQNCQDCLSELFCVEEMVLHERK